MVEKLVISTLQAVPGYKIKAHKGLVWASSARSKNFLQDLLAILRSLAGGELHVYKNMMNEARSDIMHGLASQAKQLGANAVLGMEMDSTQILPATIEIYAYGTAVVIEKERK